MPALHINNHVFSWKGLWFAPQILPGFILCYKFSHAVWIRIEHKIGWTILGKTHSMTAGNINIWCAFLSGFGLFCWVIVCLLFKGFLLLFRWVFLTTFQFWFGGREGRNNFTYYNSIYYHFWSFFWPFSLSFITENSGTIIMFWVGRAMGRHM